MFLSVFSMRKNLFLVLQQMDVPLTTVQNADADAAALSQECHSTHAAATNSILDVDTNREPEQRSQKLHPVSAPRCWSYV